MTPAPEASGELLALLAGARAAASARPADDEVAERLRRSVIGPLERSLPDAATDAHDGAEAEVWALAQTATELLARGVWPALAEAAAALQDLSLKLAPDHAEQRARVLRELMCTLAPHILTEHNGPYLVSNAPALRDWLGDEIPAAPLVALCRCGQSALKPLCDGSHADTGFSDEKDPERVPDRRESYPGVQVTVLDNRGTCAHAGFCSDRLTSVFRAGEEPFVAPSGGRMDEIVQAVRACPSGALSYAIDGREAREQVDRQREPMIEVSRDGPYRVTGALPLLDAAGEPVARNAGASLEHYSLCRCGQSQNKPFCSGMHWYVNFHDPVPDPDHEPTLYEWAGGFPALLRMTRIFYERHVAEDPLLAPLFARMSPDHPERVAAWLGETFGGPKRHSENYGGYRHMVSQHMGKGLREEQRARWVELLGRSANEAGLPSDPEFRAAFTAYLEWGSRIALENSQPGARPPENMPVPRWWWVCDAKPGSRISALAPEQPEAAVELPGPDEQPSFARHVKPLFRHSDRESMSFAFNLWEYADVSAHADAILERLVAGTMPCDGAWPPEKVDAFKRWIAAGKAE